LQLFIVYVTFSQVYFQRQKTEIFIPDVAYMYMVRKTGAEKRRQKMESIYGAGFWSVCHGYKYGEIGFNSHAYTVANIDDRGARFISAI